MHSFSIKLLALALMGVSSSPAHALGQGRQAQLRVSMVIVDSCELGLVRLPSAAAARETRVACSSFMPHQLLVGPASTAGSQSAPTRQDAGAPAQRHASYLADLSPSDAGLTPPLDAVTVATIVF